MEALFIKLLNISITASWVVLAVIVFRLFLKKAPKFIAVLMWSLVAVRLVLPISVESAFSLIPDTAPVGIAYDESESVKEESDFPKPPVTSDTQNTDSVPEADVSEYLPTYSEPEKQDTSGYDNIQIPIESADGFETEPPVDSPDSTLENEEDSKEGNPVIGGTTDSNGTPTPPTDKTEPDGTSKNDGDNIGFWESAMPVISVIWAIGVGLMLLYIIFSYTKMRRTVREAIPLNDGVWVCDDVPTSFILGVIRPKIYLPAFLSKEDAKYVLTHEKAHIRRGDYLWKPLGFLILAVYWFNPIMWLAYILFCRDIEYATDEKALDSLGLKHKKQYSMALINCSAPKKLINACLLAFGETGAGRRIKSILNYKKPTLWVIIASVVACIAILLTFMTNPKTDGSADVGDISTDTISSDISQEVSSESSDVSEDIPELTDAEKDAVLTSAVNGTWYGLGEADEGTYYYFSSGGNGTLREYTTGDITLSFNWVIKNGDMIFMYRVGGEKTVTEVSCENGIFSYVDDNGKHSFTQTEPEEKENTSWSLSEDGTLTISGKGRLYELWDGRENEIKKVVIGEGITGIRVSTFRNCPNLESVILPESLVSIGSNAFAECTSLYSIDLPDGLRHLESSAFYDTGLYNTESNWKNGGFYIDNCLISASVTEDFAIADGTVLIARSAVNGYIENLVLPNSVKGVGFMSFNSVTNVHIPASLEYIEYGAFNNVRTFTVDEGNPHFSAVDGHLCDKKGKLLYTYNRGADDKIVIPEGIKYIAENAIDAVYFDIGLYLPASLEVLNIEAFAYSHICNIEIAEGNPYYTSLDGVVYSKDGKTLVYYPHSKSTDFYSVKEGVEHIGDRAFFGSDTIKKVTLPDSVKTIGEYSFYSCENLESINFPEGLKEIKASAFTSCSKLKSAVLPDSLITLGGAAFHSAGIEKVTTGTGLVTVGSHVFYGTHIREIYFGAKVESIGEMALSCPLESIKLAEDNEHFTVIDGVLFDKDCKTLLRYPPAMNRETYTLPDGVESIGNYAFDQCYKLKIIAINDELSKVGYKAFRNCSNLMHIVVPQSVEMISNDHFEGCSSLDTVYYGGSEEAWKKIAQSTDMLYLSKATVVFNAKIDDVDKEFKKLRVFVPLSYYFDYSQTKDVFYDGTAEGLMEALIKYCHIPSTSRINSLEIRDGIAYLDVNNAFVEGISTGTTLQYEGLGALVNTVIYNLGAEKVMLSCDGGVFALPDVGAFDQPVGFFSGWLVYSMTEGEKPQNALPAEGGAMRLMTAFLNALSEGKSELCDELLWYDYTESKHDFITPIDPYNAGTIILPDELKFSYYPDQSKLKEGQVAFSTVVSNGVSDVEIVFVLGPDDIYLIIEDVGYKK